MSTELRESFLFLQSFYSVNDMVIERARSDTTKNLRRVRWRSTVSTLENIPAFDHASTGVGDFVKKLITLVPLQIARADHGEFLLMNDGPLLVIYLLCGPDNLMHGNLAKYFRKKEQRRIP